MEIRVVVRAPAYRVEGRVDEAHGVVAVSNCLLVDQSQVAGPHGSRKAGSTVLVLRAGSLIGADVEAEIRIGRNIRAVAIGFGARRATAGRSRLPGWNGKMVRRNAATTVDPCALRRPGTAGAAGV